MSARTAAAWVLVVGLLAVASQMRLTPALQGVLPEPAARAMEVAESLELAGLLRFEVDGTGAAPGELPRAVDALVADLASFEGMTDVRGRVSLEDAEAVRQVAARYATALVPADTLSERLSPTGMARALRGAVGLLAAPGGGLLEQRLVEDPLGIETLALQAVRVGAGRGQMRGGLIVDAAGDHALVLATTERSIREIQPNDPWVAQLEARLARQPLPVDWLGAPRYAAETATAVRRDVHRAATTGSLGLLLVLLLGFRSLRPVAGAVVAIGVAATGALAGAALVSPVHGIQLAFVGGLAGVAADYWIHLYVAAAERTPPGGDRAARVEAARQALVDLGGALRLAAGSTAVAFALLVGSDLPVVRGLGVMGVCTVVAAYGVVWLGGPALFGVLGAHAAVRPARRRHALALPVLLALAGLAAWTSRTEVNTDPRSLLATSPSLAAAESAFAQRWDQAETQGLVVVHGPDVASVLDRSGRLEAALAELGLAQPVGPGTWLPGPATVQARRDRLPPIATLDQRLNAEAETVGFAPFVGAGERIRERATEVPLDAWAGTLLQDQVARHLRQGPEGATAVIRVPLTHGEIGPALADTVAAVDPEATWITPSAAAHAGLSQVLVELGRYGALAVALIAALLWLHLRDPVRVALAVAPGVAGLVAAVGGTALIGTPWNAVSASVVVLLVGLSLDYGIFSLAVEQHPATRRAIVLSALTTIAGFAGLLVAASPALTSVGAAMCFGVAAAAATALVVVPALRTPEPWTGRWVLPWVGGAAWVGLVAVQLDMLLVTALVFERPRPSAVPPPGSLQGAPGDQRFGDQRLVRDDGVWLLATSGDPYTAGYGAGLLTRELRIRVEDELFDSFRSRVPNPAARWLVTRASLVAGASLPRSIAPDYLVWIQGDDDSVPDRFRFRGPGFTRRVYYHALHDIGQALVDTPLLGCSGFLAGGVATVDGHWMLARNFDFEGGTPFDRDKVIWAHRPDGGIPFVAVGFAGLTGVVSGVNVEGIAVAIQAASTDAPIRPGTPMTLIIREILQTASSLDEAEAILKTRTGFVSENVLVVDGGAGAAALFEVSPERVERIDVEDALAVTNHFRHPAFADDAVNRRRMEQTTTVPRLLRLEELLARHRGGLQPPVAMDILADRRGVGDAPLPRGHRHALDADLATHAVVIDASELMLWVSRYPNLAGGFVAVRVADLLAGRLDAVPVRAPEPDLARSLDVHEGRELLRRARRASPREAERLSRQALARMPDHPEALMELGFALQRLGRPAEAAPLLERALAAPPEYAHQVRAIEERLP